MLGNKTGSRCIDVAVTLRVLTVRKKALGYDEMQIILGAGHGDLKQPTFFFDLRRCPDAEVRGHSSTGSNSPRQARERGLITSSVWRIESEFGEEAFP
jgi:hypothetical protein